MCNNYSRFENQPLVCKLWKLEMQSGKSTIMATERPATRSGMARCTASSALCIVTFDDDIVRAVTEPRSLW